MMMCLQAVVVSQLKLWVSFDNTVTIPGCGIKEMWVAERTP